jgi:MFS family permease
MTSGLRKLHSNVWVLSATSFLRDVSSEMLIHLVPLYLANVLGARTVIVGMIEGIAETTSSLVKIYSGRLSDRLKRRKGLTVTGYGIAGLATPLLLIAQSWPVVLLYRFLDRVGKGVRTAPRDALLADSTTKERRGVAFGLHRAADSAGAFIGLLIALGIVYNFQPGAVALSADTFRAIVTWSLIPAFLAVAVAWFGVREATRETQPDTITPKLALRDLGTSFNRFLVVLVIFTMGNSTDAFLVLRAQASGATLVEVLGMLALFNFVYTCLSGPAGSLSDRYERRKVILAGWSVYALVYVGFAFSTQQWHFWILYALYGAYYALTAGVLKAFVADTVPPESRGTAYGILHFTVGIVTFPASVLAGLLWQGVGDWSGFGPAAPFLFGSLLAVVAALLLQIWVPTEPIGETN